jgi:hypothetical protein
VVIIEGRKIADGMAQDWASAGGFIISGRSSPRAAIFGTKGQLALNSTFAQVDPAPVIREDWG